MNIINKIDEFILKQEKIYLKFGEKPPQGVQVQRGKKGGMFYIPRGTKQQPLLPETNQVKNAEQTKIKLESYFSQYKKGLTPERYQKENKIIANNAGVTPEFVELKRDAWDWGTKKRGGVKFTPENLETQMSAKELFNVGEIKKYKPEYVEKAKILHETNGDETKKLLKTIYTNTQNNLKEMGITKVKLFRGMNLQNENWIKKIKSTGKKTKYFDSFLYEADIDMLPNPLSSWTSSKDETVAFSQKGDYTTTLNADMPAEQIFSTQLTGFGNVHEKEVVVLGKKIKVHVTLEEQRSESKELRNMIEKYVETNKGRLSQKLKRDGFYNTFSNQRIAAKKEIFEKYPDLD